MAVTHITFYLGTRSQCCNRVHNDNIYSTASDKLLYNLKCLLTCIRLRHIQFIDIHTQRSGIDRIKCVLRIDKCSNTAASLTSINSVALASSRLTTFWIFVEMMAWKK